LLAVVGLGNPGEEYTETRHNVGFRVIDHLAGEKGRFEERGTFLFVGSRLGGRRTLLVKPSTYMNRSGRAVADLLDTFSVGREEILVLSDDVNLPLGTVRIRARGGDGGQKGLVSIVREIGTEEFARVRLGIGPAAEEIELADFVLHPFRDDEKEPVERMVEAAASCVRTWVADGVESAMRRFNQKNPPADGGKGEKASER